MMVATNFNALEEWLKKEKPGYNLVECDKVNFHYASFSAVLHMSFYSIVSTHKVNYLWLNLNRIKFLNKWTKKNKFQNEDLDLSGHNIGDSISHLEDSLGLA